MNIFIVVAIMLVVLRPCIVEASIERNGWNLIENQLYVEVSVEKSHVNSKLPIKVTENSNVKDLLSSYYFFAMKNNLLALKQLHFEGDGTRQRLDEELVNIPNKFEGFKDLKEIILGREFLWGNYSAVEVEWVTNKGNRVNWVELINCEKKCFISDRLYKPKEEFRFFSAVMASVKRQAVSTKKNGGGVDLCPGIGVCENQIRVISSAKKISNPVFKYGASINNKAKYSSLYTMFDSVWKLPDGKLESSFEDAQGLSKQVLECCWEGATKNELFPFYNMTQIKGVTSSYTLDYLTSVALAQRLKNISSVEIVGVIETAEADFVFARVVARGSDKKIFQMFIFEPNKSVWKLSGDSKDFNLRRVLAYPSVISNIDSML